MERVRTLRCGTAAVTAYWSLVSIVSVTGTLQYNVDDDDTLVLSVLFSSTTVCCGSTYDSGCSQLQHTHRVSCELSCVCVLLTRVSCELSCVVCVSYSLLCRVCELLSRVSCELTCVVCVSYSHVCRVNSHVCVCVLLTRVSCVCVTY